MSAPQTLETSLVEWKLSSALVEQAQGRYLGNFLSGMETRGGSERGAARLRPLETSLVEWKQAFARAGRILGEPWKLP